MWIFAQRCTGRPVRFCLAVMLSALPLATLAGESGVFRQALEAARNHEWTRLDSLEQRLPAQPELSAYLEFHRLQARLPGLEPARVDEFRRRYPDSPLDRDLFQQALARYGEDANWPAIRALTETPPHTLALRCYFHRAWFEQTPESGIRAAREIWLSGHSRPAACTPLFEALEAKGALTPELVWQRLLLAFRARNTGLVRYLAERLEPGAPSSGVLLQWLRRPDRLEQRELPPGLSGERRRELAAAVAHRLAHTDPAAARQLLRGDRAKRLGLDEPRTRQALERRMVWFMTIRGLETEHAWRDQWLRRHGDAELLEQRARLAVREQDWDNLPAWLARLDLGAKRSARWQYWLGRARHEQGRGDAGDAALRRAARQRSFYGFLAARRLGTGYRLNQSVPETTTDELDPDADWLRRVAWLRGAGEYGLATDEWRHRLYRLDDKAHQGLARLALEREWPDLAVIAALHGGDHDALDWRFPRAFSDSFRRTAERYNLEPWLLMAVARRESSFRPEARSPVGARGLMQLMPATASATARELNRPAPSSADLLDPETSIQLGGAHLAQLLERYDGHRLKALAAYNAGAHHVQRWLPSEPLPVDVWIESITFRETRHYVQAVLAYRLIFALLHDDSARNREIALLAPEEEGPIQPRPAATDSRRQLSQR